MYLILYNLFQFVGYMYILTVMSVRYTKLEYDSVADTYEHVGSAMKFLQLMQYLEVLHPLFGYTKVIFTLHSEKWTFRNFLMVLLTPNPCLLVLAFTP